VLPKKNPTAHWLRLANGLGSHTPTVTSAHLYAFPMWGVAETRKAPWLEGVSVIFGAGQKKSAFSNF